MGTLSVSFTMEDVEASQIENLKGKLKTFAQQELNGTQIDSMIWRE